jgi:hypothetical protein
MQLKMPKLLDLTFVQPKLFLSLSRAHTILITDKASSSGKKLMRLLS